MDELDEQLRQLIAEACSHPPGSTKRQRILTKIYRAVMKSGKLRKENAPYYADALQKTWLYFCRNLCQANTGEQYDPARSSVTVWLNAYLKRRLQDFHIDAQKQKAERAFDRISESGEIINAVDNIPSAPDIPLMLEEIRAWAETDKDGELRRNHIKGHSTVTCQVLILRRLPPEASWETLAEEFALPMPTLCNFYRRQCKPRLRKFGESQGYL